MQNLNVTIFAQLLNFLILIFMIAFIAWIILKRLLSHSSLNKKIERIDNELTQIKKILEENKKFD